jgi:hypothetical protein
LRQSLLNEETKGYRRRVLRASRETVMNTGTKRDFFKYLVVRIAAFVGLTTISTVVMALPYISAN